MIGKTSDRTKVDESQRPDAGLGVGIGDGRSGDRVGGAAWGVERLGEVDDGQHACGWGAGGAGS